MTRPLRIELANAIYHVTSRGNRRDAIFEDDEDRQLFLTILSECLVRYDAQVLAYCLMGNHYHLVLHTRQANLSALMRRLNGMVTQKFNRRHGKVGHLFQGRFKAILVDRDAYLLNLCRYVELNPVRAGVVAHAGDWAWSSYLAHVGMAPTPAWLDSLGLHTYLLARAPENAGDVKHACTLYANLVGEDPNLEIWGTGLRQQIFLGDEHFAQEMHTLMSVQLGQDSDIPKCQRLRDRPLQEWLATAATRPQGLYLAHQQGGKTITSIAKELNLSVSRVSRLVAAGCQEFEMAKGKD